MWPSIGASEMITVNSIPYPCYEDYFNDKYILIIDIIEQGSSLPSKKRGEVLHQDFYHKTVDLTKFIPSVFVPTVLSNKASIECSIRIVGKDFNICSISPHF